jgi:hypothetical protein
MSRRGPRLTPPGDYAIAAMMQALENDSSRNALGDRTALKTSGVFQVRVPATYNLRRAMRFEAVQRALENMNREIAKHVYALERTYVLDATYVSTPYYERRYPVDDEGVYKLKKMKSAKLGLVRGLNTGIVVVCMVVDEHVSDQILFEPLLRMVLDRGGIIHGGGILGDAGFNKREHYEMVRAHGGTAYLDFDRNALPSRKQGHEAYNLQLQLYKEHMELWLRFYGFRSLIESTNHSIKTVKRILRARTPMARETEAMALITAYNMSRLPELRFKYRIDLPFLDAHGIDVIDELITRRERPTLIGPAERDIEMGAHAPQIHIPDIGVIPGTLV